MAGFTAQRRPYAFDKLDAKLGLQPRFQADTLACRIGLHPGEVWPEWWSMPEYDDAA